MPCEERFNERIVPPVILSQLNNYPTLAFVARRLLVGLITLWIISIISFVIIQLPPGDFVSTYIAQLSQGAGSMGAAEAERMRRELGLDQPMVVRYFAWLADILQGDFGRSLDWGRPVSELIGERIGLTLLLTATALAITWVVALPIGVYSAARRGTLSEHILTTIGLVGVAVPNFLLALGALYIAFAGFGIDLGRVHSPQYLGQPGSLGSFVDLMLHLLIPGAILALAGTARLIRVLRANLLDEMSKPYVVTARAKGLTELRLLLKYPTRVALNPFVSTLGITLPQLVSGSVIVSLVLGLPTLGPLLLRALQAQDMFLASAILLILATLTVLGTLLSDLLLVWLDPRIRMG
jgi:peptide/nickel transport system permease protein